MPTPLEEAIAEWRAARAALYAVSQQKQRAISYPVRNVPAIVLLNIAIGLARVQVKAARLAVLALMPPP